MIPADPPPPPSWRKPAGAALILLIIVLWAIVAISLIDWLGPIPPALSVLLYAIAGIVWILPLRPVLMWMETGKWRE